MALPLAISPAPVLPTGPFYGPSGATYFISRASGNLSLDIYKTADPTTTSFTFLSNLKTAATAFEVYAAQQVGFVVHAIVVLFTGAVDQHSYMQFDLTTDTVILDENITTVPSSNFTPAFVFRDNGDLVYVYKSNSSEISCNVRTSAGVWLGAQVVDASANIGGGGIALGTSGRVHIFTQLFSGNAIAQTTLDSTNTLQTRTSIGNTSYTNYGLVGILEGTRVIFPNYGTSGVQNPGNVTFVSADNPTLALTSGLVFATYSMQQINFYRLGGNLYIMASHDATGTFSDDINIYTSTNGGTTWSFVATAVLNGVAVQSLRQNGIASIGFRNGNMVVGFFYVVASGSVFTYNEYVILAADPGYAVLTGTGSLTCDTTVLSLTQNQEHHRFRSDTGAADATPTWAQAEDANHTPTSEDMRLRFSVDNAGGSDAPTAAPMTLMVSINGGAYQAVTDVSTGVRAVAISADPNDTIITVPRLTRPV